MTHLSIDGLHKRFGDQTAVHDLHLSVPSGAFLVLLGPSGCGKTTTLRMLAGLEEASGGRIRFDDRAIVDADAGISVPAAKRGLGMVFQSYALWPHLRVSANVGWPLRVAGWDRAAARERVAEVLRMLELQQLGDRYPAELSGGQQQRVAIARTIAPKPGVLLFDEPLSNLDARLRVETRAELARVHRASDATSVYVTHDQTEALALATHIAVMKDGRLEQFGTPDELLREPATAFVASFVGTPAHVLLRGTVADGRLQRDGVVLADAPPIAAGATLQAMYRPDEVGLGEQGTLAFEVFESTPLAGRHVVTGRVGTGAPAGAESAAAGSGGERIAVIADRAWRGGDTTRLVLPPHPAALFDADGALVERAAR